MGLDTKTDRQTDRGQSQCDLDFDLVFNYVGLAFYPLRTIY